jgi:hypothetical protein
MEALPKTVADAIMDEVDDLVWFGRMCSVSWAFLKLAHQPMLRAIRERPTVSQWKQIWLGLRLNRRFAVMCAHRGWAVPPGNIRHRIESGPQL